MQGYPFWVRAVLLPTAGCLAATLITWRLWPYIAPSASPLFFVVVMISALYGGVLAGLVATLLSAISTAYFFMTPRFSFEVDPSDIFRFVMFAAVALLTSSIAAERNREHEAQIKLVEELRAANARIRTLSDILPVCPHCKRVRVGDKQEWKSVETYLSETPDLHITHALCPDCSARHFPEFHGPAA
jgi:K+-sensing histidine kinase KdpD